MADTTTWSCIKITVVWICKALRDNLKENAPVTYSFVGVVTGIFILELWMTYKLSLPSIQILTTGIFGAHPLIAWPLSPILHKDFSHFLANIVLLTVLGVPIERHWSWWQYSVFLILTGYLSVGFGAGILLIFSEQQIAFYGFSGSVFSLAGFALTHLPKAHVSLKRNELLAISVGILALITVLLDPFTGPYFGPHWINGGHLSGFVIGVAIGWFDLDDCLIPKRSDFPINQKSKKSRAE